MRNLKRLATVGVPVPAPQMLKDNILVMNFIGKNGVRAPSLKELNVGDEKWRQIYREVLLIMRKMYQQAKLVHGDFSEFNLLYFDGAVKVIDVSQAVEYDHPNAFEFLKNDCAAITNFFSRRAVRVLNVKELFEFVIDVSAQCSPEERVELEDEQLTKEQIRQFKEQRSTEVLENMLKSASERPVMTPEQDIELNLFLKTQTPRTLKHVRNPHIYNDEELLEKITGTPTKPSQNQNQTQPQNQQIPTMTTATTNTTTTTTTATKSNSPKKAKAFSRK